MKISCTKHEKYCCNLVKSRKIAKSGNRSYNSVATIVVASKHHLNHAIMISIGFRFESRMLLGRVNESILLRTE